MNTVPNELQGYFHFPIGNKEVKIQHFSMNFVYLLGDIVDSDLAEWLKSLDKAENNHQGLAISQIIFAGMAAYDQEEGNEVDYNIYKVRDWAFTAMNEDETLIERMMGVMIKSFTSMGKKSPKK